jgi:hypothetical protein
MTDYVRVGRSSRRRDAGVRRDRPLLLVYGLCIIVASCGSRPAAQPTRITVGNTTTSEVLVRLSNGRDSTIDESRTIAWLRIRSRSFVEVEDSATADPLLALVVDNNCHVLTPFPWPLSGASPMDLFVSIADDGETSYATRSGSSVLGLQRADPQFDAAACEAPVDHPRGSVIPESGE